MSLIISLGSNLGNKGQYLNRSLAELQKHFELIKVSQVYESSAQDYLDQPDFFNQVCEFKLPPISPQAALEICLEIEQKMGRERIIDKGPRTIDIDILFWNLDKVDSPTLSVPHPEWSNRSFIVYPLMELPFFTLIEKNFFVPKEFPINAKPLRTEDEF